jgi:hypothetical protein
VLRSEFGSRVALGAGETWPGPAVDRSKRAFGTLDPFNQMLAVNETVAHLGGLVARLELGVSTAGPVISYCSLVGASAA